VSACSQPDVANNSRGTETREDVATATKDGVDAVNKLLNWSLAHMENRVVDPAVDNVSALPKTTDLPAHANAGTIRTGIGDKRMGLKTREMAIEKVPDLVAVNELKNFPALK